MNTTCKLSNIFSIIIVCFLNISTGFSSPIGDEYTVGLVGNFFDTAPGLNPTMELSPSMVKLIDYQVRVV